MNLYDQIPGLREAVDREWFDRCAAFIGIEESVCGVTCRAITLHDLVAHSLAGSPFFNGGFIYDPAAVLAFFKLQCSPRSRIGIRVMLRRLVRYHDVDDAAEAVEDYVVDSFAEAPGSSAGESPSYYCSAVSAVDLLASEYGWSEKEISRLPIKLLFQYYKAITLRRNPDAIMFNPSDTVRGEWLRSQNQTN